MEGSWIGSNEAALLLVKYESMFTTSLDCIDGYVAFATLADDHGFGSSCIGHQNLFEHNSHNSHVH